MLGHILGDFSTNLSGHPALVHERTKTAQIMCGANSIKNIVCAYVVNITNSQPDQHTSNPMFYIKIWAAKVWGSLKGKNNFIDLCTYEVNGI
jgi:hypothetical protein